MPGDMEPRGKPLSRKLTTITVFAVFATGATVVLGFAVESLAWHQIWANSVRAVAVVAWVIATIMWCTDRVCGEIAASREAAIKQQKQMMKQLRAIERLGRERIEAAHQMQDVLAERRATHR